MKNIHNSINIRPSMLKIYMHVVLNPTEQFYLGDWSSGRSSSQSNQSVKWSVITGQSNGQSVKGS